MLSHGWGARRRIPKGRPFAYACLFTLVTAVALFLGPAAPASATDDDIPGSPIALGSTTLQTLSAVDVADVFSVTLTAGEQVHIRCDPGLVGGSSGTFSLLVPGATSLAAADAYSELVFTLTSGNPERRWADFDYVPAKSGTYYLCVERATGTLDYSLAVARTSRSPLPLAPDSDDLPGIPAGSGTLTGVVSGLTDPDDVYAVEFTAGVPVTLRLAPITPYYNSYTSIAYLNLIGPGATSLADRFGHVLAGLAAAENAKDPTARETGEIEYTPTESGTYYVWVQSGGVVWGHDFAYQLSISGGEPPEPPDFSDISGSPYETAIRDLATRGVVSGFGDGTFGPGLEVSRQQFAKMIILTLGIDPLPGDQCPFADVESFWPYPSGFVASAYAEGITTGYLDGRFHPYESIKRMQLITMVARAAGLPDPPAGYEPPFGVFDPTHYPFAARAGSAGLLEGLEGMGADYPFFSAATRGECAQLLYNLLSS